MTWPRTIVFGAGWILIFAAGIAGANQKHQAEDQ